MNEITKYKKLITLILLLNFSYGISTSLGFLVKINIGLNPIIMLIQIAIFFYAIYFKSINYQVISIIGLSFIGLDYSLFLIGLFLIPKFIKHLIDYKLNFFNKTHLYAFVFIAYAAIISIPMSFVDFGLLNIFFWILTFGSGFIIYIYYSRYSYPILFIKTILKLISSLIAMQIVLVIIQSILGGGRYLPGDWGIGTFFDANKVGYYLTAMLISVICLYFIEKNNNPLKIFTLKKIAFIFTLLLFIIISDAKVIYVIQLFAFSLLFPFLVLFKKNHNLLKISLKKTLIISTTLFLVLINLKNIGDLYLDKAMYMGEKVTVDSLIDTYSKEKKYSYKYVFYERVFSTMLDKEPLIWFFGTGPGKLGSRASNTMSYDVLAKKDQKIPSFIPPHSSKWVKKYMHDLYNTKILEAIKHKSATLAFPFSGIVTLKGELGIIGFIIFFIFIFNVVKNLIVGSDKINDKGIRQVFFGVSVLWLALPLLMIFDNFQEKPQLTIPLFLLTAVLLKLKIVKP